MNIKRPKPFTKAEQAELTAEFIKLEHEVSKENIRLQMVEELDEAIDDLRDVESILEDSDETDDQGKLYFEDFNSIMDQLDAILYQISDSEERQEIDADMFINIRAHLNWADYLIVVADGLE
jgi:hypothetical protein